MTPLRVLFAPLGHFLSHFSRCMAIAEALRRRGHEIGFVSVPKDEVWLARQGFRSFPAYSMPPGDIVAYGSPYAYQKQFLGAALEDVSSRTFGVARMAADDRAAFEAFKPDVVVWDGRPTIPITASLSALPAVGINNLSMPIDNRPACAAAQSADSVKGACTTLELQIQDELQACFMADIAENARARRFIRAIPWIVPGLPAFESRAKLEILGNPVHHYVGPLHWTGWETLPTPDAAKNQGRKVILVTLGSTFPFANIASHVLRSCPAAEFAVIVNTGDQFLISADEVGGHEIAPLICLRDTLKQCDLVLHHGGHGTVMEVLRAGLPSVVIPFNGDQIDIARRLEQFGCARAIQKYPGDVTADEVAGAIHGVMNERSFGENAKQFQQELARWPDGAEMAADVIERHYWQMRTREDLP